MLGFVERMRDDYPMRTILRYLLPVLAAAALAAPDANAQNGRYQQWGQGKQQVVQQQGGQDDLQLLIEKLNKLVDEAERQRAADPRFLRDLRALAQTFDGPTKSLVFADGFEDGDYVKNPKWTVTKGRYFIERGWGLRNAIEAGPPVAGGDAGKQQALQLFGAILGQPQQGQAVSRIQPTQIYTPVKFSNAFALELRVSSWESKGRLLAKVYQGKKRDAGYRLVYDAGFGLSIERFSFRGVGIVDKAQVKTPLEDRKVHSIEWTRDVDGKMAVSVDGEQVLVTKDRGFRDPFAGVELATEGGGDFIIGGVAVYGLP